MTRTLEGLGVVAVDEAFLSLSLSPAALGRGHGLVRQLHALGGGGSPDLLDHRAQATRLIETREGWAHVGEGHLALTFRVNDVLVHVLRVLDDRHAVHLVALPIRNAPLLDRSVPPSAVVGDPHPSAVPLALEELAHVGAAQAALAFLAAGLVGEVLDAVAMRHVVLPHPMIRDKFHLGQELLFQQIVLDEGFEVAVFEGVWIDRPARGVRGLLGRPGCARLEGVQELVIVPRIGLVEGTNALALAILGELAVVEATTTRDAHEEVRPRVFPSSM
mmetsp:Transcript_102047/g.327460  ORF Transcript_102047/g.327460 Transcript_102047/m.327460 type:complete len:275 (-) Transcript_102047:46-870(-)